MKKVFCVLVFALCILTSFNLFSQDTLKYVDLQSGIKPKGDFSSYQSKSGYVYKIGDGTFKFLTQLFRLVFIM